MELEIEILVFLDVNKVVFNNTAFLLTKFVQASHNFVYQKFYYYLLQSFYFQAEMLVNNFCNLQILVSFMSIFL